MIIMCCSCVFIWSMPYGMIKVLSQMFIFKRIVVTFIFLTCELSLLGQNVDRQSRRFVVMARSAAYI
jgi:hypothetical protein